MGTFKKEYRNCVVCDTEYKCYVSHSPNTCGSKCYTIYVTPPENLKNCPSCLNNFTRHKEKNDVWDKKIYCDRQCERDFLNRHKYIPCIVCGTKYYQRNICSRSCASHPIAKEYREAQKVKEKTSLLIETLTYDPISPTEFTSWQIEDIFKLDIINTMDISDDVNVFSLKKN